MRCHSGVWTGISTDWSWVDHYNIGNAGKIVHLTLPVFSRLSFYNQFVTYIIWYVYTCATRSKVNCRNSLSVDKDASERKLLDTDVGECPLLFCLYSVYLFRPPCPTRTPIASADKESLLSRCQNAWRSVVTIFTYSPWCAHVPFVFVFWCRPCTEDTIHNSLRVREATRCRRHFLAGKSFNVQLWHAILPATH